jgi:L-rhamnose mutarotase
MAVAAGRQIVERTLFTFEIRPGTETEYRRRHDAIWPELVAALRQSGISNYTIFRQGTTMIAYAECVPDAATAFAKVGTTDVNARWSHWFEDIIVQLTDANGNQFRAEEVWHMAEEDAPA